VATRTVVDGGTLVYEWQGSSDALRPIILMAHQDVVPAEAAQDWRHPPFSGAISEGSIWGRGSVDNKGALVAIMEAVEALVVAGVAPQRTLLLVLGHDEEVGGSGARAAARYLASQGIEAEFVLDEGSLVVADHPVTGKAVALIGISEKGFANVRISARGSGGHASAPPPETAVSVLAQAIAAVMSRPFPRRYEGPTRAMLQALAPEAPFIPRMAIANDWLFRPMLVNSLGASAQGDAMLHTTIAPTMLAGSPKQNVLPAEAHATFNLRIAPGDSVESALAHLRDAVKSLPVSVELVGEAQEPSGVSPTDGASYELIAGAARAVFEVPVVPAPVIAATDSRHLAPLSPNIYRFQPLKLTLEELDMIHGTDERLELEALGRMIGFYGVLIATGTAR
jgi:carboxypeptidase PM20D1